MPGHGVAPSMVLLRPQQAPAASAFDPVAVGRAIVTSPAWRELGSAALVVHPEPPAGFGVIGRFDASARARLRHLQWQLDHVLPHVRHVDYATAEDAVFSLARTLRTMFGADGIGRLRFTAIPRGGHIVLGMLAYALDLTQEQMTEPHPDDAPLVVVDDCALTGGRFRRFLDARPTAGDVVFATLYAPPQLREAIGRDDRVTACVSAHDLRDLAPEREGPDYAAWRERWRARHGDRGYWVGQPEHVWFAWSEPDIGFWNAVTGREEKGWRLAPPGRCLAHRAADATGPGNSGQLQVQPPRVAGPLRPPDDLIYGRFAEHTILARPAWPSCLALEGTAAEVWDALVRQGSQEGVAEALARAHGRPPDDVRADVDGLVNALLQREALTRCRST